MAAQTAAWAIDAERGVQRRARWTFEQPPCWRHVRWNAGLGHAGGEARKRGNTLDRLGRRSGAAAGSGTAGRTCGAPGHVWPDSVSVLGERWGPLAHAVEPTTRIWRGLTPEITGATRLYRGASG